jgi:hypothetical protein
MAVGHYECALQHVGKIGGPVNDITLYQVTTFQIAHHKSPICQVRPQRICGFASSVPFMSLAICGQRLSRTWRIGAATIVQSHKSFGRWARVDLVYGALVVCNLESGSLRIK